MKKKRTLLNSTCLPIGTVIRSQASDPRVKVVEGLNNPRLTLAIPTIYVKGYSDE